MSKLDRVLNNLGNKSKIITNQNSVTKFSSSKVHQAIIENIYFAGYFKESLLWQTINLIGFNKLGQKSHQGWTEFPLLAFLLLRRTVKKSLKQTTAGNFSLKASYLLKNLFNENIFDLEDIEDFLVYLICQNAFARIPSQERSEIVTQNWMDVHQKQYLENAATIGLVNEVQPKFSNYDETWVMGAGRYCTMTRIRHLKKLQDIGIDTGTIRLLSGNRELWLEIDNIGSDMDEAKNYLLHLAKKNNIKIDQQQPFIVRNVVGNTRTYLNYDASETKKLTETMMMRSIYNDVFGVDAFSVIDDDDNKNYRPTTESTVENITKNIFKNRLEKGDLKNKSKILVMIVSSQPYCERQRLTTKRVVDKILKEQVSKKIVFDAVAEKSNHKIAKIHSEFSALIAEQFWQHVRNCKKSRKRSPQRMIFSPRYNDINFIPPLPITN